MIALLTSATRNRQVKRRRSPRSTDRNLFPKVFIFVPFAACREKGAMPLRLSVLVAGIMETSEPVSTRNLYRVVLSSIVRRRLSNSPTHLPPAPICMPVRTWFSAALRFASIFPMVPANRIIRRAGSGERSAAAPVWSTFQSSNFSC